MKPSVCVVGCGRAGTALTRQLAEAGYTFAGLASKRKASAERAARLAGCDAYGTRNWEFTKAADVVFITTPDGLIEPVCREIADHHGFKSGARVFHCSGAHPSTILASAKSNEAVIGSLHPLQSFAEGGGEGNPFQGIIMSVEGEPEAVQLGRQMATDLGAVSYEIRTDAKILYHAAAVVASNYLVTLQGLAFRMLAAAGIPETEAYKVLGPLINGTLSNIQKVGITEALTGPIARGDAQTIEKHLSAIQRSMPADLDLYRTLGRYTVEIASARSTLSPEVLEDMTRLLEDAALEDA